MGIFENVLCFIFLIFFYSIIIIFKLIRVSWKSLCNVVKFIFVSGSVQSFQVAANTATIVAAIITSLSLGFGYYQFKKTQGLTCSTKATDLYLDYTRLQAEISRISVPKENEGLYWKFNSLWAITEAIYILTKGDDAWLECVKSMVKQQEDYLTQLPLLCKSFDDDFIKMSKKEVPALTCK